MQDGKINGGKNYILAIAISTYEDANIPAIDYAVTTTNRIIDYLASNFFFEPQNIHCLYDEAATFDQIDQKFVTLIKLMSAQDNLLVLFIGHSFIRPQLKESYWIPFDSGFDKSTSCISNTSLLVYLKQIKARHIFLVADAGMSNIREAQISFSNIQQKASRQIIASGKMFSKYTRKKVYASFFPVLFDFLERNPNLDLSVDKLIENFKRGGHHGLLKNLYSYSTNASSWRLFRKTEEDLLWKKITIEDQKELYKDYLRQFPEGKYTNEAQAIVSFKIEETAWRKALEKHTIAEYQDFLAIHPESNFRKMALQQIQSIRVEMEGFSRGVLVNRNKKNKINIAKRVNQQSYKDIQIERLGDRTKKLIRIGARKNWAAAQNETAKRQEQNTKVPPLYNGKVLSKIPSYMLLGEEYFCEIRISPNQLPESCFLSGLDDPEHNKDSSLHRDLVRLSRVMSVEIIVTRSGEHVEIRALTDEEQWIDKDDLTFWKFSLIPKKIGGHSLIIKIKAKKQSEEFGEQFKDVLMWEHKIIVGTEEKEEDSGYELISNAPTIAFDAFELKHLIGQNRIKEVLDELSQLLAKVDLSLFNQLIEIRSQFEAFDTRFQLNVIDFETYLRAKARIDHAIISLIDRIEINDQKIAIKDLNSEGSFQAIANLRNML